MAGNVCAGFIDDNGLDIGCILVTKEYMLENYPNLVPWMKAPALWMWGLASGGILGDQRSPLIFSQSSPVQTVSSGTNWKQVSANICHAGGIKTDGTLWLWGQNTDTNTYGRLGNNSAINASSPVQTISAGTNWKQVSLGEYHSAAVKTDGSLWTWGFGTWGILGNNGITNRSSPVQTISAGTNWLQVSAARIHTAAIKSDGSLWLWGSTYCGVLGNNESSTTVSLRSSPIQTISTGTNWRQVSLSQYHSAAIKTDGSLWLWGSNIGGRLGDNSFVSRSSPVQTVSSGTDWKQVAIGPTASSAIKTDGTLWLWGSNASGILGNNSSTIVNQSSPVQTVSGGTNWLSSSVGSAHVAAIKTDGSLWLWGSQQFGRLGNNTNAITGLSSPIQTISGGTNWRNVCASNSNTAAITDEGDY